MMNPRNLCWAAVNSLVLAVLLFASAASASEVSGVVTLSGKAVEGIVVSIEGVQVEGQTQSAVYTLDHKGLDFTPHLIVVRAGATIEFKNSDGMPCRIYSVSPAGIFVLSGKDTKPMKVTFDRPGVIEIRCADHPRIRAFLVVKENSYFAMTDAQGRYRIPNLPQGRYNLQVWYEGVTLKNKTIHVRTGKTTVNIRASRPQDNSLAQAPLDPARLAAAAPLGSDRPNQSFATSWRSQQ